MARGQQKNVHFQPPPEYCDLCGKSFEKEKYMIDGAIKGTRGWACMCAECFLENGRKIGCGDGQLYLRDKEGWLEVAGFCGDD
jgi:hypothetical protein